jgi:hypothetical protein
MTSFLKRNTFTIELDKLPAYVEWNGDWKYQIDADLIKLIMEFNDTDSNGQPIITDVMKTHFERNIVNRLKNGVLHIKWSGRKGSLGRRYSNRDPEDMKSKSSCNLGVHSKYIKNTIYEYMGWVDYDMVAGHPTILCEICKHTNMFNGLPAVQNYIDNRDDILKSIIDYYSVIGDTDEETAALRLSRSEAKDLFNLTIYGGGFSTWEKQLLDGDEKRGKIPKPIANKPRHPTWLAYNNDIKKVIDIVYSQNPNLASIVCTGDKYELSEWERKSRTMSYFCGIIENDCLKWAYKYGVKAGLFPERSGDLCYDGFTMPPPPPGTDLDTEIENMNAFILQKTGLAIQMKVKPFEFVLHQIIDKRRSMVADSSIPIPITDPQNNFRVKAYLDWKEKFEVEWCKIQNTATFIRKYHNSDGNFQKFVFLNKKQLADSYAHHSFIGFGAGGKQEPLQCIAYWMRDPTMHCYEDVGVYPPPMECPKNILNLWIDSPYESQPFSGINDVEIDHDAVQKFNDHIHIICKRDPIISNWVRSWLAHSIQKPSEKPEHALNFIGNQGTGKSTIVNIFGKLYGHGKVLETTTPERDCWGNFNELMANAFLVVLSEVDKRNAFGADGRIKALITDYSMTINPKGKQPFPITSFHRVICATNSADPSRTSNDDRRNMLIRCNDELKGNTKYFNDLNDAMKRPHALRSLYWFYKSYDISSWNFRNVPKTDYHNLIIENTRNPMDLFLESFVAERLDKEFDTKTGVELLQEFRKWKDDTGHRFDENMNAGSLIKKLKTELSLPDGAIEKGKKTKTGVSQTFDIKLLSKHYNLGCLIHLDDDEPEDTDVEYVDE